MKVKVYTYKNCGTCRNARKWLESSGIDFDEFPIREVPPSRSELEQMLKAQNGELKKLFNTSGQDYRALNLSSVLSRLDDAAALELLETRGNLVKRPFLLGHSDCGEFVGLVGFKVNEWQDALIV